MQGRAGLRRKRAREIRHVFIAGGVVDHDVDLADSVDLKEVLELTTAGFFNTFSFATLFGIALSDGSQAGGSYWFAYTEPGIAIAKNAAVANLSSNIGSCRGSTCINNAASACTTAPTCSKTLCAFMLGCSDPHL